MTERTGNLLEGGTSNRPVFCVRNEPFTLNACTNSNSATRKGRDVTEGVPERLPRVGVRVGVGTGELVRVAVGDGVSVNEMLELAVCVAVTVADGVAR